MKNLVDYGKLDVDIKKSNGTIFGTRGKTKFATKTRRAAFFLVVFLVAVQLLEHGPETESLHRQVMPESTLDLSQLVHFVRLARPFEQLDDATLQSKCQYVALIYFYFKLKIKIFYLYFISVLF